MTALADNSSEQLVRFSRRSMAAVLLIVTGTGAMALAMTLWPEGPASRFMETAGWVYPIAIVLLGAALRATRACSLATITVPESGAADLPGIP